MSDQDDVFNRRIEQLEYRLSSLERFGNVLTSTQRLTTFTSTGGVGTILGLLPSTATIPGSSYGLLLRSATGGLVRGDTLAFGIRAASATGTVLVASTSYATASGGPTVTARLGPTKRCLVTVTGVIQLQGAGNQAGFISFKTTGASTRAPSDLTALVFVPPNATPIFPGIQASARYLVTLGSSGSHVFTMMYKSGLAGSSAAFGRRNLIVEPF